MKFRVLFLLVLTLAFLNCKSTATLAEIEHLKETAMAKNFIITADVANTTGLMNTRGLENLLPPGSNLGHISLVNTQNNFTIKNDSISLDMPFYGERRFASGYGTESGLQFEGIPENVESSFNQKKNTYEFEYLLNTKTESLRISLTLFSNKTSRFTVNSSHRSTITYSGHWKIPQKE
jgi:hypothetical protein